MLRAINSRCVVDDKGCERNIRWILARNPQFVEISPERTDKLAVVAAGPSARDYLDEIREYENIWAINGAYDYLVSCGIVPTGFVGCDPLPGLAAYVAQPNKKTTYYLSVQCDRTVFQSLEGYDVKVWFPRTDVGELDANVPPNCEVITGGTTALSRSPFIARCLGFRDVTLYGADSSFNGRRYVYGDGKYADDSKADVLKVAMGGYLFLTEMPLLMQVSQIGVLTTYQTWGVKLNVRCKGLMNAYIDAPVEWDALEDVEKYYKPPA